MTVSNKVAKLLKSCITNLYDVADREGAQKRLPGDLWHGFSSRYCTYLWQTPCTQIAVNKYWVREGVFQV